MRKQLELENTVASELAGTGDSVLRALESHLDCDVFLRGNVLTLDGDADRALFADELDLLARRHPGWRVVQRHTSVEGHLSFSREGNPRADRATEGSPRAERGRAYAGAGAP